MPLSQLVLHGARSLALSLLALVLVESGVRAERTAEAIVQGVKHDPIARRLSELRFASSPDETAPSSQLGAMRTRRDFLLRTMSTTQTLLGRDEATAAREYPRWRQGLERMAQGHLTDPTELSSILDDIERATEPSGADPGVRADAKAKTVARAYSSGASTAIEYLTFQVDGLSAVLGQPAEGGTTPMLATGSSRSVGDSIRLTVPPPPPAFRRQPTPHPELLLPEPERLTVQVLPFPRSPHSSPTKDPAMPPRAVPLSLSRNPVPTPAVSIPTILIPPTSELLAAAGGAAAAPIPSSGAGNLTVAALTAPVPNPVTLAAAPPLPKNPPPRVRRFDPGFVNISADGADEPRLVTAGYAEPALSPRLAALAAGSAIESLTKAPPVMPDGPPGVLSEIVGQLHQWCAGLRGIPIAMCDANRSLKKRTAKR